MEGDHFGEIGLLYNCPRTATVIARNYNTMAKLRKDRFRDLVSQFPEFLEFLKKHSYRYNYKRKTFLMDALQKIPYIQGQSKEIMNKLMYSMELQLMDKGEILLKPGDDTNYFYIVESGCIEFVTEFEGNEFILEFLSQGSLINYHVVFSSDQVLLTIRAREHTRLLVASEKMLNELMASDQQFNKSVLMFQNRLLKLK